MRPQYSISIPPTSEPITLAQASDHLRVDSTDDQSYISDLISVAREYFDAVTGRSSAPATYVLTAETWEDLFDPSRQQERGLLRNNGFDYSNLNYSNFSNYVIQIFRTPLVSVQSIKYYDATTGNLTTLDPTQYRVITGAEPGRVQLVESQPAIKDRIDAIQITFVAGNDSPPAMSRHGIKMLVANFYEQRVPIAFASASEIPYTLRAIIENQKVGGHF